MTESDSRPQTEESQQVGQTGEQIVDRPNVGLIATPKHSEATAASILRAQRRGCEVFVTHDGTSDNEGIQFARQLGANVILPPEKEEEQDLNSLRQLLVGAAGANGSSGLIFAAEPTKQIDFERSIEKLNGQTVCDAVYKDEPEPQESNVVIGIPAYNEESTITNVVNEASKFAETVLVVDDGSDDKTAQLAQKKGATVVEHEYNEGYGSALQTLFSEANKRGVKNLAIIDADGQHDPSDVPRMVKEQRQDGVDLVIGSRFADGGGTDAPLYRRFGLSVINVLTNVSMGVVRPGSAVSDTQCGFRVYNEKVISSLASDESIGKGMSASTDILYHVHSNDFEIAEVGTNVSYDVKSANSQNPLSHGMSLVGNILKTIERERPILILGIPGIISTFIGIGFGYWTVMNYIKSGTFPLGLAVSSAIFGLAGSFAMFTSIILHALNQHLNQ